MDSGRIAGKSLFKSTFIALGLLAFLASSGCQFGPRALERSYGPYYESLRHADEEELLRNLVHIRYHESPGTLSISSIAAQYELSGQAEARPFFIAPNPSNSNVIFKTFTSILPDVFAEAANRPTISLTPGDDSETIRKFLTPINAEVLTFLLQTGWPVPTIIELYAERINGVPNAGGGTASAASDPAPGRFHRVVELFQTIATRELVSVRLEERLIEVGQNLPTAGATAAAVEAAKQGYELRLSPDRNSYSLVRRDKRLVLEITPGAERDPELIEMESMLNLVQGEQRYDLIVATGRDPDPLLHPSSPSKQMHITPRSTAQVFAFLSNRVLVPDEHVACGITTSNDTAACPADLLTIHSVKGHRPPPCSYAAVRYRDWWFFIDDRDMQSKTTFAIVLQLSRLDLRRRPPGGGGPVLTLPAGR